MKKIICLLFTVLLLSITLTACGTPSSSESADKKLSKLGYSITIDKNGTPALIQAMCGTKCELMTATNQENGGTVYAFYFNSIDDASASLEYISEWAARKITGAEATLVGKMIYFGNEQGLKDFK